MSVRGCLSEALEDAHRHGPDVGPHPGRLHHVQRVAEGGGEDLAAEGVVPVDLHDVLHELHPRGGDVVEPAHERGDEARPRLGREQGLASG